MRSKYYVINAYSEWQNRRVIAYETDIGVLAWFHWWRIVFSKDYSYSQMEITR